MNAKRNLPRGVAVAVALAIGGATVAGCGESTTQNPVPLALFNTESSWIPGQASLMSFERFAALAERSGALARLRQARRELELARIESDHKADERRAKAEALRRYQEAKRKAEAEYQKALREAARQRRLQARRLAAARAKRQRELDALRKKLQVKPGEECKLPEIAAQFRCRKGMTPLPKPLPRH